MFKNETIVKLVLVGLAMCTYTAYAQTSTTTNVNGVDRCSGFQSTYSKAAAIYMEAHTAQAKAQAKADMDLFEKKLAECQKNYADSSDGCSSSAKDFSDASKEFVLACGKANLKTDLNTASKSSGYACSKQLDKCKSVQQGGQNSKDYSSCPPFAAQDLKDLKDEAEKARKHIDELQDKMPELEQKKVDAGNQYNDKLSEISDQAKEAQSKYSEAISQAAKDRGQAIAALRDKVNGYNDDINKSQQQIVQNAQGAYKAQTDYQQAVHQINATCFTQAQQQAAGERAMYAKAGNPFPSMTAMFKKQGMTDQKWWDSRAQYYYNRCRAMKITTDQLSDAANTRNAAIQSVNDAAAVIQNQITQTQAKIRQTGLQTGCFGNAAGPGGETDMCGIIRDLNQANQRAQQELANNIGSGKQAAARAASQAGQAANSADQQIQSVQQKIASEQNRLNSLNADLDQRAKYASSSDPEAVNKIGEAQGKMLAMSLMAQKRVACCAESYEKDCNLASDFLFSLGVEQDPAGKTKIAQERGDSSTTPARNISTDTSNAAPINNGTNR